MIDILPFDFQTTRIKIQYLDLAFVTAGTLVPDEMDLV